MGSFRVETRRAGEERWFAWSRRYPTRERAERVLEFKLQNSYTAHEGRVAESDDDPDVLETYIGEDGKLHYKLTNQGIGVTDALPRG